MLHIYPEGRRLCAAVPWDAAQAVQAYLRRHGVHSTVVLDTATHEARIESWDGTDLQQFQLRLHQWESERKSARPVVRA